MPVAHVALQLTQDVHACLVRDVSAKPTDDVRHQRVPHLQLSLAPAVGNAGIQSDEPNGTGEERWITGARPAGNGPIGDLVVEAAHARNALVSILAQKALETRLYFEFGDTRIDPTRHLIEGAL